MDAHEERHEQEQDEEVDGHITILSVLVHVTVGVEFSER